MYHLEEIVGESPDLATEKAAPFEPYDGAPDAEKESEAPLVKSMLTVFASAGSAGQLPSSRG